MAGEEDRTGRRGAVLAGSQQRLKPRKQGVRPILVEREPYLGGAE